MKPASRRLLVLGLFLTLAIGLLAYRPAVQQDLLDGTYTNPDCPGFEVRGGVLRFDDTRLRGKVERDKGGYYLLPQKALRYDIGPKGCRLLSDSGGFKHRAMPEGQGSAVTGMEIYSADLRQAMVWTRTGLPYQVGSDNGVK